MGFINRIRLPFRLTRPQYNEEAEMLPKANGTVQQLSVTITKSYELETAPLLEKHHDRLKIALRHDTVAIEGEKYFGNVVQDGDYSIDWQTFLNYPRAKATSRVFASNFIAVNSNCGTCEEYNQVHAIDDDAGERSEGDTFTIDVTENDAICCYPFQISLVTFNSTYLQAVNIVGNSLEFVMKATTPTQNNVVLATYRITCENGMYDEARVRADIDGSTAVCGNPANLTVDSITTTSAHFDWDNPGGPGPYFWKITTQENPGLILQSGPTSAGDTQVSVTGLTQNTPYLFCVQKNCILTVSDFVCIPFQTMTDGGGGGGDDGPCGLYQLTLTTSSGENSNAIVTYYDCNFNYQNAYVEKFTPAQVCMRQISPGVPSYYEMTSTNAPVGSGPSIGVEYLGPC